MKLDVGIGLGLLIATLVVYAGSTQNGFVSIDDPLYILANPNVTQGLSWDGIVWAFTHFHSDNYHPLTWISHQIDCSLFGLDAAGHHAMGALLHAANAVLLFVALLRLTGERWPSAFVAALFALHPLRVESVAWASERKDVLSGFFFLSTLVAYTYYTRRPGALRYAAVALGLVLGLLAKPMLVTLPFVLLLLDYWPLARQPSIVPSRRLVLEKLPLFAIAAASSLVTLAGQVESGSAQTLDLLPLGDRIANAFISGIAYLGMTLWPTGLAVFYPHPALVTGNLPMPLITSGWVAAAVLLAISTLAWRARRSHPHAIVGWLWYLGMLAPVIGIVQVGIQARADRYTYLPLIGIAIMIGWGARDLVRAWSRADDGAQTSERARRAARVAGLAGAVLIVAFAQASTRQVAVWRDDFSLNQHAISSTRNNYVAEHNLAAAFAERGALDTAVAHYNNAIGMRPDYVLSLNNLALVLGMMGRTDEASVIYREALRIQPDFAEAHLNLGTQLATRGDFEGARRHYEAALRGRPSDTRLMANLAALMLRLDDVPGAIAVYERALSIDPQSAKLHENLASALMMGGRSADALQYYRATLLLDPGSIPAADRIAWIHATHPDRSLRNGEEALRLAQETNRVTAHRNPVLLVTLAAAHAETGDFDQAVHWQTRAIKLTPARDREALRIVLARYEGGHPFRDTKGR